MWKADTNKKKIEKNKKKMGERITKKERTKLDWSKKGGERIEPNYDIYT